MLHRFSMQGIQRTKSEMENDSTLKLFTSCLHLWLQKFVFRYKGMQNHWNGAECEGEQIPNQRNDKQKTALNFRRVWSMSHWFIERNDGATMLWISTDLQGMWKFPQNMTSRCVERKKKERRKRKEIYYSWCGMRNKFKMTHERTEEPPTKNEEKK